MRKDIIYKYLRGEATIEELESLLQWVKKSKENEKFFAGQVNLWIAQSSHTLQASHTDNVNIETHATEKGYKEIMSRLADTRKIYQDIETENTEYSKHETKRIETENPKLKNIEYNNNSDTNTYKRFLWGAAAGIVILIALNIWQFADNVKMSTMRSNYNIAEQVGYVNYPPKNEIYTVRGSKAMIVLPDSSVVWLNSDSKIEYPNSFDNATREIHFTGEAYFDIVSDSLRPMLIYDNKGYEVRVLGTKFNMKSYENDADMEITLYSGRVQVFNAEKKSHDMVAELKPNEMLVIGASNKSNQTDIVDPIQNAEWKDGRLVFNETLMSDVIKMLERWHGVDIEVQDKDILDYKFTAQFESESIIQILDYIKMVAFIDYTVKGNKVSLKSR